MVFPVLGETLSLPAIFLVLGPLSALSQSIFSILIASLFYYLFIVTAHSSILASYITKQPQSVYKQVKGYIFLISTVIGR